MQALGGDNTAKPPPEAGCIAQLAELAPGNDEGFLHDVFGVHLSTQMAEGYGVGSVLVTAHEDAKGLSGAGTRPLDNGALARARGAELF